MKKPGLTLARHAEIGRELYAMHEALVHLHVELSRAYPISHRSYNRMRHVMSALGELRSTLDSIVFAENPDEAHAGIYYPGNKKAAA